MKDDVLAKVKLAQHDPHVANVGFSKSLANSFRALDPMTFTMLANELSRKNSYFSTMPQVTLYGQSDGFGPELDFRPGYLDFSKPATKVQTYFATRFKPTD